MDHSVISRSECGKKADIAPSEMESEISSASAYTKISDNTVRMNDLNLLHRSQPGFTMNKKKKIKKIKKVKQIKQGKNDGALEEDDFIMYVEEKWRVRAVHGNMVSIVSDRYDEAKTIDITKAKF